MTAATLLAIALVTGGVPCRNCGPDGQPSRPGLIYHHACDGGKCFSCQRPLFGGPSAPPFDYRLIFNYPWSQAPCYAACAAAAAHPPRARQPTPIEVIPAPIPVPADAGGNPAPESVTRKAASKSNLPSHVQFIQTGGKQPAHAAGGPHGSVAIRVLGDTD